MRVRGIVVVVALILAACDATPSPTPTPAPSASTVTTPTLAPSPSPSPSPSPRPLAAGRVVQVLVDGLNIRTSASRDASAVGVVQAGQRVTIVSGPQDADGFSWYEVSRGRDAARGWLAAGSAQQPWLTPVSSGRLAVRYQEGQRVGIGLMGAAGQDPVVLEGAPTRISWSPDGTRLAFAQPGLAKGSSDIFVMRADGSERQPIADGSQFAWSPDSTRLAVPEGSRITLRSAEDGRDVGRLPLGALTAVADLAWSPDSRLIAFTAAGTSDDDRDVYVMRSDTAALSRLTDGGAHDTPVWSPSANRLAFNSPDGVLLSDPAGDDVRKLSDGRVAAGAWSPDGLFLLITRFGGLDSLDLRLQGSATLVSDDAATTVRAGSWAPDGSRILYERVAKQGGAVQAWTANPDGSGATQVPNAAGVASWQALLGG
jgi:dipeptidyl aminopeptidase/acylaminoacyl peptidase